MSDLSLYRNLALSWQPETHSSRFFNGLVCLFLATSFVAGFVAMQIKIPEKTWEQKAEVPTRIANYIAKQPKKIEPVIEPPKPKPKQPKPKPKEQPKPVEAQVTVARDRPGAQTLDKPLSQPQQAARETVQNKGLLGLRSQLSGLTQDAPRTRPVRGAVSTNAVSNDSVRHQLSAVAGTLAEARSVDTSQVENVQIQTTELAARDDTVVTTATQHAAQEDLTDSGGGRALGRGSSDVASVFNRNKSSLNSLYERERRTNLGLQGRVIFQLVIEPSGMVSSVKLVSSELNHSSLESRLSARVKQFQFAPSSGKAVTVTFPVEFRPS